MLSDAQMYANKSAKHRSQQRKAQVIVIVVERLNTHFKFTYFIIVLVVPHRMVWIQAFNSHTINSLMVVCQIPALLVLK